MPRITCPCGENINLSIIPNPQMVRLFGDVIFEKLLDRVVKIHEETKSEPNNSNAVSQFRRSLSMLFFLSEPRFPDMYECPHCGRLVIVADIHDQESYLWYKPEKVIGESSTLAALFQRYEEKNSATESQKKTDTF